MMQTPIPVAGKKPGSPIPGLIWKIMLRILPPLLAGGLCYELSRHGGLPAIYHTLQAAWRAANPAWLLVAAALMPLNWWAETQKWRPFVQRFEPLSRARALGAVWAGVAVSLCTPNRVGEYGGRILFVRPEHRWQAVVANLVGNMAQALVLATAGAAGAIWLAWRLDWAGPAALRLLTAGIAAGVAAGWFAYFHLRGVVALARRLPLVHRLKRFVKDGVSALCHYGSGALRFVAIWAVLRYLVYATQYFLLLRFFGVEIGLLDGFAGISTLFLLQTGLPLPPATGLLARGNLAVGLWAQFGGGAAESLAATFSLWIINLIFPAFLGTFFMFYVKTTKITRV